MPSQALRSPVRAFFMQNSIPVSYEGFFGEEYSELSAGRGGKAFKDIAVLFTVSGAVCC